MVPPFVCAAQHPTACTSANDRLLQFEPLPLTDSRRDLLLIVVAAQDPKDARAMMREQALEIHPSLIRRSVQSESAAARCARLCIRRAHVARAPHRRCRRVDLQPNMLRATAT